MSKSKQHRDEQFMLALLAVILMSTAVFLLRLSSENGRSQVLHQSTVMQETPNEWMLDLEGTNSADRPGEFAQLKNMVKDL